MIISNSNPISQLHHLSGVYSNADLDDFTDQFVWAEIQSARSIVAKTETCTIFNKRKHSLSLFDGFGHGKEDTVEQYGRHDEVVEVLVGGEVDAGAPHRRPRRPPEQRARRREPVYVVFAEPLRHHAERLQRVDMVMPRFTNIFKCQETSIDQKC
ncbi:hypothetical protein EVAR_68456_1 [Eumeta japonica]|uniref:Uncharacterized protein n=1 Tax=Eumeta variegata TaxID=151549 RepID=A0A4C1ZVM6_EUMVA|nr:hypothetical protein EVAR_68456_1 [Eumeta japonica]